MSVDYTVRKTLNLHEGSGVAPEETTDEYKAFVTALAQDETFRAKLKEYLDTLYTAKS